MDRRRRIGWICIGAGSVAGIGFIVLYSSRQMLRDIVWYCVGVNERVGIDLLTNESQSLDST